MVRKKYSVTGPAEDILGSVETKTPLSQPDIISDSKDALLINSEDFEIVEQVETDDLQFELPKEIKSGEKFTRIRVVKEGHEVEEVSEDEIKDIVRSKKDKIQKIIIEQVRHKSADRMSLLLGPSSPDEEKSHDLIETKNIPVLRICTEADMSKKGEKIHPMSREELLALEMRFNKWFYDEIEKRKQAAATFELIPAKKSGETQDDKASDYVYRKQTYIKKDGSNDGQYFYKAKNHLELYNVGKKYFEDYQNGTTHFGFYGHNLRESREKTVFGLYAFFTYESDLKVTIFTPTLDSSFYFRTIQDLKVEKRFVQGEDIAFEVYTYKNLEIIEFSTLARIVNKMRKYSLEDLLKEYFAKSKIIFWDLPEISQMDRDKEIFFPIIRHIDNVSILVGPNFSKTQDLNSAINYFKKYGIPIKGVLMAKDVETIKDKKAA